jgi:hypothetical protein
MKRTIYSIRRHEDKDGDNLTPEGKDNAVRTGEGIQEVLLDVYHSKSYNRTRQTAEGITKGKFGTVAPKIIHASKLLDMLDPEFPEGIEDREELLDYWLKHANGQSGKMYEAGANVIKHVLAVMPNYSTEGRVENITHAPNAESALINLLDPKMRMKDIGGTFKTGEGFRICLDRKEGKVYQVTIEYRDTTQPISIETMHNFVNNLGGKR